MNFRNEVSSSVRRPTQAMVWINPIKSRKSVADLMTSSSITEAKLKTHFAVLGSQTARLKEITIVETSNEESSFKKKLHKRKTLSHGKARPMDDL